MYLPNINRQNDNIIIINVQISTENRFTKIELAIPAVTIVTAVCIVNIVHIVIKKKIINFNFSIQNPILVNEVFTLKIYHQKKINKKLYIKVFNRKKEISLMAETISG